MLSVGEGCRLHAEFGKAVGWGGGGRTHAILVGIGNTGRSEPLLGGWLVRVRRAAARQREMVFDLRDTSLGRGVRRAVRPPPLKSNEVHA